MYKTLLLIVVALLLALFLVGVGWLLGRARTDVPSLSRADLSEESALIVRRVDARADAIERKLDILLNIATNVPPDLGMRK